MGRVPRRARRLQAQLWLAPHQLWLDPSRQSSSGLGGVPTKAFGISGNHRLSPLGSIPCPPGPLFGWWQRLTDITDVFPLPKVLAPGRTERKFVSFHACSYSDICFSRHNGVSRIPSNLTNDPLQGYQPASDAQTCYSRRNILLPRSSERIIYISLPTTAIILFANFLTRQDSVKLTGWIQ